jgi:hypothetical protein
LDKELGSSIHCYHVSFRSYDPNRQRSASVYNEHSGDSVSLILALLHYPGNGLFRLISLKHEFPNNFHQLLHPSTGQPQKTELDLERKHFPYFISDKELTLSPAVKVKVFLKLRLREGEIGTPALTFELNNMTGETGSWDNFGENMKVSDVSITGTPLGKWTIKLELNGLDKEKLDDVLVLLTYTAS